MKLSRFFSTFPIIAVLLIVVSDHSESSELSISDPLSNADLNHLISILDSGKNNSDVKNVPTNLTLTSTTKPNVIKKRIKIRKPTATGRPTTSTTLAPSTTVNTTAQSVPVTPITSTPSKATTEVSTLIDRREDSNIELLKEITPPSQHELVQQLSLLNSLLTTIGDNGNTTNKEESLKPVEAKTTIKQISLIGNSGKSLDPSDPQTLAALDSILTEKNVDEVAAALLGLGPSAPSTLVQRQVNPAGSVGVDTEAAKALSEFLLQASAIENQNSGIKTANGNLNNAAASNQVSSLISLLGTINSFPPQTSQQQRNPLLNEGLSQNEQTEQIRNALLSSLLEPPGQNAAQSHSLSNLFNQPQTSSFDLGSLLASQAQSSLPGIGGFGSGILSSIGSFGSSMLSTVSNIFSGSGSGGKPRVRGMDTRLGLGYRFGDSADAQIMWDVGPQLFTDTLKNEERSSSMARKADHVDPKDAKQQGITTVKRQLQLQTQNGIKKSLSLLDIWNAGKESFSPELSKGKPIIPEIPDQLLTPPLAIDESDKFQIARIKNFMKRSSLKNYYSKPSDDPFSGHSTLTEYEKMLLSRGKDSEFKAEGVDEVDRPISPRKSNRRRKPRPEIIIDQVHITEPEYGNDNSLSESAPKKSQKPYKERPSSMLPKKSKHRPLPHQKWNPRPTEESEEEALQDEQKDENERPPKFREPRPHRNRDEDDHRPSKDNYHQRERDEEEDRRHSSYRNRNRPDNMNPRDQFEPYHREIESSHSESRPSYNHRPKDDYDDYEDRNVHTESRPEENYAEGPTERPYDGDETEEYSRPPAHSRSKSKKKFKDEPEDKHREKRPRYKAKKSAYKETEVKSKSNQRPKFSLSKIFHYWVRKAHKMPPPNRRKEKIEEKEEEPYERFTYTDSKLAKERSDDRSHTKARRKSFQSESRSFNRKTSRTGGIPYDYYETYSPELNPEANDSFLRRNQVKSKTGERQKHQDIIDQDDDSQSTSVHISINPTRSTPSNSVMSFVRNYLSSKTNSKKNSNKPFKAVAAPSITTLSQLLSNPSSLNPLKMLPIGRKKRPLKTSTELAIVDGKLQIIDSPTTTTTVAPIVHIGKDMSFEQLTQVLSAVKKSKKKLKVKKVIERRKDEDDQDENDAQEEEEAIIAQEKVDSDSKKENQVDEEYDETDDLKGIFIDIESGEVDVLKPVAELTSFEPKKEEEPSLEKVEDEYEDEDGDGIADSEMKRKQEIFSEIQKELKQNYDKMKTAHDKAEAKQRRKDKFTSKGMDESMSVVSKYFSIQDDDLESDSTKSKSKYNSPTLSKFSF